MELRVLFAVAHRFTWYGRWGYEHGRGAFNISKATWRATLTNLHNTPMAALMEDFLMHTSDGAITEIIDRYQANPLPSLAKRASVRPLTRLKSVPCDEQGYLLSFPTFVPSVASSPLSHSIPLNSQRQLYVDDF